MKKITSVLLSLAFLLPTGCMSTLTGAGEMGVGYRSETKLFAYHSVDGDKEGKQSKSELDLTPLLDLILKYQEGQADEAPTDEPAPDGE